MARFVFHPKRKVNGKTVASEEYSGAYTLPWASGRKTVALKTTHKRIAEKRLDQHLQRLEFEHEGFPVPAGLWGSQKRKVTELVNEYRKALLSKHRAEKHTHDTCKRIETLCRTLNWASLHDIKPLAFERWRASCPINPRTKQTLSAKTLNEYLVSINAFINWAEKLGYVDKNPLRHIEKAETRGHERKKRRAWSNEEFSTFMASPPKYRKDYRSAVFLMRWTGLRVNETQTLTWGDVFLDQEKPYIIIRAQRSKNHKEESIPLLERVASLLRSIRPLQWESSTPVLNYKIPASEQLKRDLKRVGIEYRTELGDLDRHSLRHTFGTWLVASGVNLKEVQVLMRHADINMTANRYTDVTRLPITRTLGELDKAIAVETYTSYNTPNQHTAGQNVANAVTNSEVQRNALSPSNKGLETDTACHNVTGRESDRGCSGWDRTSDQVINSHLLYR